MSDEKRCCGLDRSFARPRCERRPSVVRDGKGYCWQHDPVRLDELGAKRRAEAWARSERVRAENDARVARQRLEAAAGVLGLTDDELRALVSLGGVRELMRRAARGANP